MRAAIYARVSTADQTVENQRLELHAFATARRWDVTKEYLDQGISGSKQSRPALDDLLKDARRRRFDTLVVSRLDRLGRNLRHLILLLDELAALGVAFVSLHEGIDCSTNAGRLQLHLLSAIAEYERGLIVDRVKEGLARRRSQGLPLGRPRQTINPDALAATSGLSTRKAAAALGVSHATVHRARLSQKPEKSASGIVQESAA